MSDRGRQPRRKVSFQGHNQMQTLPGAAVLYSIDSEFTSRDFVRSSYQELKKANPKFPILVRECSGVQARLIARYGKVFTVLYCMGGPRSRPTSLSASFLECARY